MAHDRVLASQGLWTGSRRWRSGQASRHDRGRSELIARSACPLPHRRSSLALRARSALPTGSTTTDFLSWGRARALVASPSASSCAASRLRLLRRRKEARGIGLEGGDAEAESGASDGVAAGDGDGLGERIEARHVVVAEADGDLSRELVVIGRHRCRLRGGSRGDCRRRGARGGRRR